MKPVLVHVKPMEAQTNQTISKILNLREAEKIGHPHLVAKRKIDTTQSDGRGRKMKKIKSQSQSHDSGQLSSELAGGKNHDDLGQGTADAKNPRENLTQQRSDEFRTESVSEEIKRKAITPRNVDNKNFSKDLSCDDILNCDNFFGPEIFVTSANQRYVSPFPETKGCVWLRARM
uniref:Uncharacterized protein n=1 Tax=Magallana gigas TaxID=29159 RepID=A0A8W8HXV5_MAGGI